jgi:hypothetical protein
MLVRGPHLAMTVALLAAPSSAPVGAQTPARVAVHPTDDGRALVNPGMGWVLHHFDNSLDNYGSRLEAADPLDDFPGLSTVYLRLAWSYLEPAEGCFDWPLVDTPAQRWIARGKKVALRFSASEGARGVGTPLWVKAAGARGYFFEGGKGVVPEAPGLPWEPDFDDGVFLAKLDRFVAAAAARYDGDPNVAWVDVGSFGIWGEGHTFWSTKRPYSAETVVRHIETWRRHFHRTRLVAIDDFSDHGRGDGWLARALELGLALRDDSIMVEPPPLAYKSAPLAQRFWPLAPVILESEHYGPSKKSGNWGDGRLYEEAMEAYHASYAAIHWWPREFLAGNRDLVARMNRRLGRDAEGRKRRDRRGDGGRRPRHALASRRRARGGSVRRSQLDPPRPGEREAGPLRPVRLHRLHDRDAGHRTAPGRRGRRAPLCPGPHPGDRPVNVDQVGPGGRLTCSFKDGFFPRLLEVVRIRTQRRPAPLQVGGGGVLSCSYDPSRGLPAPRPDAA